MDMPEKMIDWLLDIAKYILSGIVITSFFGILEEMWMIYTFGTIAASVCFLLAFMLAKHHKNSKKK